MRRLPDRSRNDGWFWRLFKKDSPQPRDALVIGLGNPGEEYALTRHNVGFMVVDRMAARFNGAFRRLKAGQTLDSSLDEKSFVLAKPHTFVNRSGEYVKYLLDYYRVALDSLLVVHDDITLALGEYKFRFDKSASGHKGVISIMSQLGTADFYRLRVGIGQPGRAQSRVDYVLSRFEADEAAFLDEVVERCATAALDFVRSGGVAAMNLHNKRPKMKGVAG